MCKRTTNPKSFEQAKNSQTTSKYFLSIAELWFERKKDNITPEYAYREWRTLEKDGKNSTVKRICQSVNQIMDFAV